MSVSLQVNSPRGSIQKVQEPVSFERRHSTFERTNSLQKKHRNSDIENTFSRRVSVESKVFNRLARGSTFSTEMLQFDHRDSVPQDTAQPNGNQIELKNAIMAYRNSFSALLKNIPDVPIEEERLRSVGELSSSVDSQPSSEIIGAKIDNDTHSEKSVMNNKNLISKLDESDVNVFQKIIKNTRDSNLDDLQEYHVFMKNKDQSSTVFILNDNSKEVRDFSTTVDGYVYDIRFVDQRFLSNIKETITKRCMEYVSDVCADDYYEELYNNPMKYQSKNFLGLVNMLIQKIVKYDWDFYMFNEIFDLIQQVLNYYLMSLNQKLKEFGLINCKEINISSVSAFPSFLQEHLILFIKEEIECLNKYSTILNTIVSDIESDQKIETEKKTLMKQDIADEMREKINSELVDDSVWKCYDDSVNKKRNETQFYSQKESQEKRMKDNFGFMSRLGMSTYSRQSIVN